MAHFFADGSRARKSTLDPDAIKGASRAVKSGAGLSPFWNDCPAIMTNPGAGYGLYDDFNDIGLIGTITTIITDAALGRYLVFGGAGSTIVPDAALGGGIVLGLTDIDQATSITTKQLPYQITSGAGSFWMETRIKSSTITTAEQAFFLGLMDATPQTAAVPLTADGAIANINCVGFHKPQANLALFDTSYKANDVTAVEVNSNVGTLEVDTYIKLGMKFDTRNNVLSFYINGATQAGSKTIPDATGTDFPADVLMAPVMAILAATDDAETLTVDWWKFYQAR